MDDKSSQAKLAINEPIITEDELAEAIDAELERRNKIKQLKVAVATKTYSPNSTNIAVALFKKLFNRP